jgi:DNA-binding PadR family transcriptional regulator
MSHATDPTVEPLLPLPPAFLHILIALGDGERHGYSIMQEVAERTGGRVRMSPGTLYGSIKRMLGDGLIEELTRVAPPGAAGRQTPTEERRRFYRITRFGRRVAAAEAERLASLLSQARSSGLVPRKA